MGDGSQFLIHGSTGVKVYAHGQTYCSGSPRTPYHHICTAPQKTVTRCWSAVSKREAEARRIGANARRQELLESFPGFRS